MKKTNNLRGLLHAVICLGLLLIIISLGCSAWIFYGYFRTYYLYDTIRKGYVTDGITSDNNTDMVKDDGFPDRDIDIEGLIKSNPDFLCWIYYGDGGVDYPVVKEKENNINGWMHKAFDGTKNSSGTIFMPYDADSRFHDMNTFLYGHNMADGSMFGSLKKIYRDPDKNYKDPYFYIWTKYGEKIKYRVTAMYIVNKNSDMYAVPMSDKGYRDYFSVMMSSGSMSGFMEFTEDEEAAINNCSPIVTLSTCYGYAGTDKRLLVHGVETDRKPFIIEETDNKNK